MNTEKINVMHIRDSHGIYGAERVILTLGKNIDKERYKFMILCMRRKDGGSEELMNKARRFGIQVIPVDVNGRIDLGALTRMRKIFKNNKISIIHSHDYKSDLYGLIASINLGIKQIVTVHGSTRDSLKKKLYLFITEQFIYRFVDRLIAVSEEIFQSLRKYHPPKRIELVQNGIDLSVVENEKEGGEGEDAFSISNEHKVFGVIGRLFPDKGHRFFLEALSRVVMNHPSVMALIVGDGPARNEIAGQVRKLKLENCVQLCGVWSDMKRIYDKIDFLVIPSLREGLPYTLLEAMAYKVPVLASTVGDIPRLVQEGVTGYLVPPGDTEALVKGMNQLLTDPEKSKEMAEKAHFLVMGRFSADRMVSKTEEVYAKILWKNGIGE